MKRLLSALLLATVALGSAADPSAAKNKIETVHIADGVPLVSYSDQLDGPQQRDYVLSVKKGKKLNVSISSKSDAVYFRVYAPDGTSIYNSRNSGSTMNQTIQESGLYTIHVHLREVEAGHIRHYSLVIGQK
ncbi:MAG: PPC domain-containing protein [Amaricoccus sp.]